LAKVSGGEGSTRQATPVSVPSAASITLLTEAHVEGVAALAREEEFRRFWMLPSSFDERTSAAWIRHWIRRKQDAAALGFAVVGREKELVGVFALLEAGRDWDSALLKGFVAPAHRGRGYGSYAARQATAAAFKKLRVREVLSSCRIEEIAWSRVLAKLDFVLVKTAEARDWRDGRPGKVCYFRLARV
jgi:RimJ/RimL family protein N-acetyltransferase